MKPLCYIFQNQGTENFPAGNQWEKFPPEMQDVRLFNFAAASWEINGFEVRRLTTRDLTDAEKIPFLDHGNGPSVACKWYPPEWWQLLAAVRKVIIKEKRPDIVFTSLDVQNVIYDPDELEHDLWMMTTHSLDFINFQAEHFSLSTFVCDLDFCERAGEILLQYDWGKIPRIAAEYVSDERILRDLYPAKLVHHNGRQLFGRGGQLIHHARSTLAEKFNSYAIN